MKPFHNKTKSTMHVVVLGAALLLGEGSAAAQQSGPVVTGDARVDKLLSQMRLEEKLALIHGTH
jgi:beta-glucosidase